MILSNNVTKLRCVVVGGGGFLGAHLCEQLVDRGAKTLAYGRNRHFDTPFQNVHWISGALEDTERVLSAIEGADVVFHLATSVTPLKVETDCARSISSTIGNTLKLLDLCRTANIKRVVYASSGGCIYGNTEHSPTNERNLPAPISSYGITKLTEEHFLWLYNHHHKMQNIALRIANPFGPYNHSNKNQGAVSQFARQMLKGQPLKVWGNGDIQRDFLPARDVAEAMIRAALYNGQERIFNIGSGVGRSLNEIITALEKIIGKRAKVTYIDDRSTDVAKNVLDCSLAKRELGWESGSDFICALAETIDWIRCDLTNQGSKGSASFPSSPQKRANRLQ